MPGERCPAVGQSHISSVPQVRRLMTKRSTRNCSSLCWTSSWPTEQVRDPSHTQCHTHSQSPHSQSDCSELVRSCSELVRNSNELVRGCSELVPVGRWLSVRMVSDWPTVLVSGAAQRESQYLIGKLRPGYILNNGNFEFVSK